MDRYIINCVFALLALFSLGEAKAQDNVIDRVEWVVGDKAILRSDIEESIRYWLSTGRRFDGDPYCVVGEDLAVQQLFLHQAALDSIEVDETMIMRKVDAQMEYVIQQIGSKEKLEEYFDKNSSEKSLYASAPFERLSKYIMGCPKLGASDKRTFLGIVVEYTFLGKNFLTSSTTCWVRLSLPSYIVRRTPSSSMYGL